MLVRCDACQNEQIFRPEQISCACGGAWEQQFTQPFDPALIDHSERSLWRFREFLSLDGDPGWLSLPAGCTPLVPLFPGDLSIWCKLEYFAPTGSFKDRGSSLMINTLLGQKVTHIVEDSSGNAGASIAAYAVRAGIKADIFIPADTSAAKAWQIQQYGARLHRIDGPREEAGKAALLAGAKGAILAMHALHPAFLTGMQTAGFEIWEQFAGCLPEVIVTPIGQGLLFLGIYFALTRIREAGLISKFPRLIGVQSERCAPIALAIARNESVVRPFPHTAEKSLAEGIAITAPVRGRRILQAIRESGGDLITVTEDEIIQGQKIATEGGLLIENTSAVVIGAIPAIRKSCKADERILLMLTGSGLKNPPPAKRRMR